MGVLFYDKENMANVDNSSFTSCSCNVCNQLQSSSTTAKTSVNAQQTTNNLGDGDTRNKSSQKSSILREIVGNCKEVKIEENIHNLRIVGNNNRIRITLNVGDITIIGNNTRLNIKINHGVIKYTGNEGRISLGNESTDQLVDYNGCNGVLKVKNFKKSSLQNPNDNDNNCTMGSNSFNIKLNNNRNEKYASFSGSPSEVFMFHDRKRSMPNITTKQFHNEALARNCNHPLSKSSVPNFGNILIANSSNICISPYGFHY